MVCVRVCVCCVCCVCCVSVRVSVRLFVCACVRGGGDEGRAWYPLHSFMGATGLLFLFLLLWVTLLGPQEGFHTAAEQIMDVLVPWVMGSLPRQSWCSSGSNSVRLNRSSV